MVRELRIVETEPHSSLTTPSGQRPLQHAPAERCVQEPHLTQFPMARKEDPAFEISFYESILRRDSRYTEVIELLGGLYTKTGRIADGLKMDRKLVRLLPKNA